MDDSEKFVLPSPNFNKTSANVNSCKAPYLTPCGMNLLPREKQPPPMFGPRGATVPARFLNKQNHTKCYNNKNAKNRNTNNQAVKERQFCEACDMELQTEEDLRRHKGQHEPCPVEGCKYRGHPNVMEKHICTLHASGLFDKFKKLSTPEEIAAWRAERKKRYPTLTTVQMKQKAKEQRQKRGERLEPRNKKFGTMADRKRISNKSHNHKGDNKNTNDYKSAKQSKYKNKGRELKTGKDKYATDKNKPAQELYKSFEQKCTETTETEDENISEGFMRFKGTKEMENYKHIKSKQPVVKNVLSNFLAAYESDDGTESDSSTSSYSNESSAQNGEVKKADEMLTNSINRETDIHKRQDQSKIESKIPVTCCPTLENEKPICDTTDTLRTFKENITEKESPPTYEDEENNPDDTLASNLWSRKLNDGSKICSKNINENIETISNENEKNLLPLCENNGDNSSDDAPEEAPISHVSILEPNHPQQPHNITTKEALGNKSQTQRKSEGRKRKLGLDFSKAKLRKQNTMLEKLLEPDIRHERNILLQCVRFICENDFFGIGHKKEKIQHD